MQELFHVSIFQDRHPEVQEGWNFFKGLLEIVNPDSSTSLFGGIKFNNFRDKNSTFYNGYLNKKGRNYFLNTNQRQSETPDYFLVTIVSDGFIDMSKTFIGKKGYVRIRPKRKKDKTLVIITLCLHKDEKFFITVKDRNGVMKKISIEYLPTLEMLNVEEVVTPVIKRPTITSKAFRLLMRLLYKRPGIFCGL